MTPANVERRKRTFWAKVSRGSPSGCWPWIGYRDKNQYGRYGRILAHRVAYELSVGRIPDGMVVCHSCDIPSCCNPDHLWVGTQGQNVADMDHKGRRRSNTRRGTASNKAKLTPEQAIEIYISAEPRKVLAGKFKITKTAISLIKSGRNWASATGAKK